MKIHGINTLDAPAKGGISPEISELHSEKPLVFTKTISDISTAQQEEKLTGLLEEITEQGSKLVKTADIKEFEKYRKLIKSFMDEVVSDGYAFSKNNSFQSRGRNKVYATVNTVNKKLEDMAKQMLQSQSDTLDLLGSVDEIRGLIVDLML